jgi:glutaconate CoA-transferase subunit B
VSDQPAADTAESAADYSVAELLACRLAHEFEEGERISLGANVNFARAAVLLAHHLWAPSMKIMIGNSWTNFAGERDINLHADTSDFRDARWAESWLQQSTAMIDYRFFSDAFVVGGMQIDAFGNTNLIGIGSDYHHLKVRGPGPIGTTSHTTYCDRYYIAVPQHSPQAFVEKCDFVSAVGWGKGGQDGRSKLGLPGGGPRLCLTPLCVFDFDSADKRLRLQSVNPGHTVAEVEEATGCEIEVPAEVPTTEVPSAEELRVLREVIDPNRLLAEGI